MDTGGKKKITWRFLGFHLTHRALVTDRLSVVVGEAALHHNSCISGEVQGTFSGSPWVPDILYSLHLSVIPKSDLLCWWLQTQLYTIA
jgi:hypothetical protein